MERVAECEWPGRFSPIASSQRRINGPERRWKRRAGPAEGPEITLPVGLSLRNSVPKTALPPRYAGGDTGSVVEERWRPDVVLITAAEGEDDGVVAVEDGRLGGRTGHRHLPVQAAPRPV